MVPWAQIHLPIALGESGPLPFLDKGFVLHCGLILWCARYVHSAVQRAGYSKPLSYYVKMWARLLATGGAVQAIEISHRPARRHQEAHADHHLISTLALLLIFAASLSLTQLRRNVCRLYRLWLRQCCGYALEAHRKDGAGHVVVVAGACSITVTTPGTVDGWD